MTALPRCSPKILTLILSILILCLFSDCKRQAAEPDNTDYRAEMRLFVQAISSYAKNLSAGFLIIPQNGQELITDSGEADGRVMAEYILSLDGSGRESMFYGYYADDQATPAEDREHLLDLCRLCEEYDVEVLATDYCSSPSKMDNSYLTNNNNNFISFAADDRELSQIPDYPAVPYQQNNENVTSLSAAKNFLYLINPENFPDKSNFIQAIAATNYDLLIIDFFLNDSAFTSQEIDQLSIKANGGTRLVICYLSIGEAEDYRYYWQSSWKRNRPDWLEPENPDWPGNYKVKYWHPEWQKIIFGQSDSYLDRIVGAGFDGVYLDIVDGFEYFEER